VHFPQASTIKETTPSTACNGEPVATYGYSWMLCAIGERKAADRSKVGACDELKSYLEAPLEAPGDVIAWWGVSTFYPLWNMLKTVIG